MPESPDVNALKRRSRRRLVGAIALVLLAVIVLPMVFDQDPRPPVTQLGVRIPSEDDSSFTPKVTPRGGTVAKVPTAEDSAAAKVVAPRVEEKAAEKAMEGPPEKSAEKAAEAPAANIAEKPAARPEEKAASLPTPDEKKRAENALADAGYVVVIGTYAEEKNVRALISKLKSEKIPAYAEQLETAKGPRTRVRAGPFPTEEAAERARTKLQRLGVQAGPVAPKAE